MVRNVEKIVAVLGALKAFPSTLVEEVGEVGGGELALGIGVVVGIGRIAPGVEEDGETVETEEGGGFEGELTRIVVQLVETAPGAVTVIVATFKMVLKSVLVAPVSTVIPVETTVVGQRPLNLMGRIAQFVDVTNNVLVVSASVTCWKSYQS